MDKIYVVTYKTESGDEGIEGYWLVKPTDNHLQTYFKKNNPDEFDRDGRTIFWTVEELSLQELPKPAKNVTPSI